MARGNNFDALRLLGALAVLVFHQLIVSGRPDVLVGGYSIARIAVFMFFAVSGYLISASWKADPEAWRFLARRVLRMGPGWAVLMVITYAIYSTGFREFSTNPLPAFNASLWTLTWEILCYAALGLCLLLPGRIGPLVAALAALLLYRHANTFIGGPELCMMFAAGMLLHAFPPRWSRLAPCLLVAAIALHKSQLIVMLLIVPVLSIWIGTQNWPGVRRAGRFGDFSYGIYIYAWPVQQFVVWWLGADSSYWLLLSVSLAITGSLAALSWHVIEGPALGLKRYLKREPAGGRLSIPLLRQSTG